MVFEWGSITSPMKGVTMAVSISSSGSFDQTLRYLHRVNSSNIFRSFDYYGQVGVDALKSATPADTHKTAEAWNYKVRHGKTRHSIIWNNTNEVNGVQIAVIIQYGHGTGTGGWVQGTDYINPVIRPLFDKIVDEIWKEVTSG